MPLIEKCYKCNYLGDFKKGKNNRHEYNCLAYPNGLPEIAYNTSVPYQTPPCILEKKKIRWSKKNPQETLELIKELKSVPRERVLTYNYNSPEVKILERLCNQNQKFIEDSISILGLAALSILAEEVLNKGNKSDIEELNKAIESGNKKTALNILFSYPNRYNYDGYGLQPMRILIFTSFLHNKYKKYKFKYKFNPCRICGGKIDKEYAILLVKYHQNSNLFKTLFKNFRTVNDIDICGNHINLESYYPREKGKSIKKLKDDLKELYKILNFIPPSNFHSTSFLWSLKMDISPLQDLIVHINQMYPYENHVFSADSKTYKKVFGNWLNALIESDILDNSTLKTYYGYKCRAKDGHICNSLMEKIIDDFFTDNNIKHTKEPRYPLDPELNPNGLLRGDWLINNDTIVEFFGLLGNKEYTSRMERKFNLINKLKLKFIGIYPGQEAILSEIFDNYCKVNP